MSFTGKLKKFEKTFKTAKKRAAEEGGFGSELPDAKYKARLDSCSLGEAQSSGRIQVDFCFKVTAGEEKGEKVHKYQAVESEDDQVWLARDLRRFGIEAPDSAKDLEDIVELLDDAKPELVISLKTKDSGQFCYIDKVTSEVDSGKFAAEDDDEDGDGEDEDAGEEDEASVEVGMDIEFESKSGKQLKGKIIKILGDESVKVKTPKGNIHTVELDNITMPEDEGDDDDAADTDDDDKPSKKSKKSDDDDDDDVVIEVGMKVKFESESGKNLEGKIIKILEEEELVKVKTPKGKVHKVKLDDLTLPDEEDDGDDDGDGDGSDDDDGKGDRKEKAKAKPRTKSKSKAKPKVKKRKR